MIFLFETLGWIGTALVLLAYFLVSNKKMGSSNKYYQLMNLFGAIGIGISVFYKEAWPALFLQITWGGIAMVALIKSNQKN